MPAAIAFVSSSGQKLTEQWLQALATAMPQETVRPLACMSAQEKQLAEIAIVANPDPRDIAALPGLRWMHSVWAGVERLVAELGETAPPIVRLVDPELTRTMAEAVLAWVYYLQRDMPAYCQSQAEKRWAPLPYRPPSSLSIGILGLGVLGSAAAARLQQAGFRVAGWSRSAKAIAGVTVYQGMAGLDTLLGSSDIVVLLLPLTAETTDLMNKNRFASVKKGAGLINFARGPIIDAQAMLDAFASGQISHAVLDVFNTEPLPPTCPYWLHPHITVLPHISASTSPESAAQIVAHNVAVWRRHGRMPETIDRQRGY